MDSSVREHYIHILALINIYCVNRCCRHNKYYYIHKYYAIDAVDSRDSFIKTGEHSLVFRFRVSGTDLFSHRKLLVPEQAVQLLCETDGLGIARLTDQRARRETIRLLVQRFLEKLELSYSIELLSSRVM